MYNDVKKLHIFYDDGKIKRDYITTDKKEIEHFLNAKNKLKNKVYKHKIIK